MEINIDGKPCEGVWDRLTDALASYSVPENHPTVSEPAQLETTAICDARTIAAILELCEKVLRWIAIFSGNPKWWHYYKHGKKARVRRKYRRKMERVATVTLAGLTRLERRNP